MYACRTTWGWTLVPLLLALPEELLARACRSAGACALVEIAESCTALAAAAGRITAQLLREVHGLERRRALRPLPQLRQWHFIEQMSKLAASTLAMLRRPVVLVGDLGSPAPVGADVLLVRSRGYLPDAARVVSIACGRHHVVFLDDSGRAWAVGDPRAGGVSVVDGFVELSDPAPVAALRNVRLAKVACGNGHTVAMATTGEVFTWGRELSGAAVDAGNSADCTWRLPDASQGLPGEAVDVAAGEAHVAAASLMGDTYAWGQNHHGQCARDPGGDSRNCILPVPMRAAGALENVVACRVACGRYHTAVLSVDGAVFTFGAGLAGQLGRAASAPTGGQPGAVHSWRPERVPLEAVDRRGARVLVVQLACGDEHTVCLTDTGRVLAFGNGERGQLALGGVRSHRSPVLVRILSGVREVAAGADWTLFRCRGSKVYLAGRGEGDLEDNRLLRQIVAAR